MTIVLPRYVNPAKPGKKYGTLKTADGSQYMLPAGMENAFESGVSVDVPLRTETWGKGDDAREVQIINGRPSGSMGQNSQSQSGNAGIHASVQQGVTYSSPSARQETVDKDLLITTTALMKSYIEAGHIPLENIDHLMAVCVETARKMVRAASGL
jgi:hypothetical protein